MHLAGLHGLHLRQGARIADLWRSNVEGTRLVTAAALGAGVRRMVLASTTAVYGPGSGPGEAAAILDEQRRPEPDNPYATAKLAAELVMATAAGAGMEVISLRLGRFFREDERSYQIRKLSTGLDLEDAIDAMVAVCEVAHLASGVYCVASDLPLSRAARHALGTDCHAILEDHLPGFGGGGGAARLGAPGAGRGARSTPESSRRPPRSGRGAPRPVRHSAGAWSRPLRRPRSDKPIPPTIQKGPS